MSLTLTPDQQQGKAQLISFLANPLQPVMVIEGYSGTGKSTLVDAFLKELPVIIKTVKLINPGFKDFEEVFITATTNKAAEALSSISGRAVRTIYSVLGLRIKYHHKARKNVLVQADEHNQIHNSLLLIDEASYANKELMNFVYKICRNCKIIWMGDPAQLLNADDTQKAPVFNMGYPTVRLTQVVRQDPSNQIQALSTMFRNAVNTLEFQQFLPNGQDVIYLNRIDFDDAIVSEFTRPDWNQSQSRVLAWTNAKVEKYNKGITQLTKGTASVQEGDYVVCNQFVQMGKDSVKTDALVRIKSMRPHKQHGARGHLIELVGYAAEFFMPGSLESRKRAFNRAIEANDATAIYTIQNEWIDLRATFASTINKSQGSTYDKVFIDLDDINRCSSAETIARLMYVGVSRARFKVYLTGILS